jgi:shikimate kinase
MKIFLVGMPGSGKTTLGKQLAQHLDIAFVDLDAEIERAEQRSISEIFSHKGEDYFRLLESRLLREWAASAVSFVMATGGGAPCFHRGIDLINEYGISVFLDCPVSELIERVRKNRERPLLLTSDEPELKARLEKMLANRRDCYSKANIILQDATLHTLLKRLELRT